MEKEALKCLFNKYLCIFGLIVLLSGCATTYWVHDWKTHTDFTQDNLYCNNYAVNMAYRLSPPKMQAPSYDVDVYVNPKTGYGYGTAIPRSTVDLSGFSRAINIPILYNACMKELGWREVPDTDNKDW